MKFSKIEIEGTQSEITQFLNCNSDFDKPVSQSFKSPKSTNETTRAVPTKPLENKILSVVASIIAELKRREFTAHEVSIVANKLVGYANKKRFLESED